MIAMVTRTLTASAGVLRNGIQNSRKVTGLLPLTSRRCNASTSYKQLTEMRVPISWIEALEKEKPTSSRSHAPEPPHSNAQDVTALPPRKMSDSHTRVILPLAEDKWLLDKYLNVKGDIRLGSIFMDLDALSGVIAKRHNGDRQVMTVTAAVDRINIQNPLQEICNLELSGRVTFATGRSSLEISCQVAKLPRDGQPAGSASEDVILTCAFTMVSLDPQTRRPTNVPGLEIESEEEKKLYRLGEANYNAKKSRAKTALRKMVPNDEESSLIHSMWLRQLEYKDTKTTTSKPDNVAYMDTTRIHSTQIMQPQFRNRHSFMIFGGYLMQQTYELAFTCAVAFSHTRPTFVSLDPSTFENPVPVGSVLYLTATVAYTEETEAPSSDTLEDSHGHTRVQIRVDSSVRSVEHGDKKPTGQFNYTFLIKKIVGVMPRTYQEFMIWTDARRRARQIGASSTPDSAAVVNRMGDDGNADRMTE